MSAAGERTLGAPSGGAAELTIGACWAQPESFGQLRATGFAYAEILAAELHPEDASSEAVKQVSAAAERADLPVRRVHGFLPPWLAVVGPSIDRSAVERHVARVLERAGALGAHLIVFGSGDARRVPTGYSRQAAWGELVTFLRRCARLCERHGGEIAIEHLNRRECNIVTSIDEARRLAAEVAEPTVTVLADLYHVRLEQEELPLDGFVPSHVHVAGVDRAAPVAEDGLREFMTWLAAIGYRGPVSIECEWRGEPGEQARAIAAVESEWQRAVAERATAGSR